MIGAGATVAVFDFGTGIEEVEKEVMVGDKSAVPRPLGRGAGAGVLGAAGLAAFATAAAAIAAALATGAVAGVGATGALAGAFVAFVFAGLVSILVSAFTAAFLGVTVFAAGFAPAADDLDATAGAGLTAFGGALGLVALFAFAAGFAGAFVAGFAAGFAFAVGFTLTFAFGAAFADDGLVAGFFAAALLLFALVAMSRRTLSLNFFASRCIAAALGTRSLYRFACQTAQANRRNAAGGGL